MSINVTFSPIITDVKHVQYSNAYSLIDVTEIGIVTEAKFSAKIKCPRW